MASLLLGTVRVRLHGLFDAAKDAGARTVAHIDAHRVTEFQETSFRRAVLDGFIHAHFGQATISDTAVAYAGTKQTALLVRYRARADDGAGRQLTRFGGMGNQLRK